MQVLPSLPYYHCHPDSKARSALLPLPVWVIFAQITRSGKMAVFYRNMTEGINLKPVYSVTAARTGPKLEIATSALGQGRCHLQSPLKAPRRGTSAAGCRPVPVAGH